MPKVLGIVAEYNPFHNGHMYHIQNAKEQAKADYVVAVMTGNFTQRGGTSIINKWEKTKMAISNGVDLVIELQTLYSISSAENFASGAIKILDEIGIVTHISFGMEAKDLAALNNIANVIYNEPIEYKRMLKLELNNGVSYPKAREIALTNYLATEHKYDGIIGEPNNILAVEYLKAMKIQKSQLIPIGIRREKVFYNSTKIVDEYASSTGIRHLLLNNNIEEIARVIPSSSFNVLLNNIKNGTYTLDLSQYSLEIIYKLRTMSIDEIRNLPEVSEGLENSIKDKAEQTNNLIELINNIKSKRYTQTRIQRIMVYALLGITKKDMEMSKKITPYVRILGCSQEGKKMLSEINWKSKVITSVKKFEDSNYNKNYKRMLEIDKRASDIYTMGYRANSKCNLDYTTGIIVL